MSIFLDVIATIVIIPFLAMATNVTINDKRDVWLSLILTIFIFIIIWRIWV